MASKKYYLKVDYFGDGKEVTEKEFIRAERDCGFYPKSGSGCATGGFSSGGTHGYIEYSK